jgi:hypothetical protein
MELGSGPLHPEHLPPSLSSWITADSVYWQPSRRMDLDSGVEIHSQPNTDPGHASLVGKLALDKLVANMPVQDELVMYRPTLDKLATDMPAQDELVADKSALDMLVDSRPAQNVLVLVNSSPRRADDGQASPGHAGG